MQGNTKVRTGGAPVRTKRYAQCWCDGRLHNERFRDLISLTVKYVARCFPALRLFTPQHIVLILDDLRLGGHDESVATNLGAHSRSGDGVGQGRLGDLTCDRWPKRIAS